MIKIILVLFLASLFTFRNSSADFLPEIKSLKQIKTSESKNLFDSENLSKKKKKSKAFAGFNLGTAVVESEVGFAVGAYAEFDADGIFFLPQTNYWKAGDQNNFEICGLARKYLTKTEVVPYLDGGVGVSFYSSDSSDYTKVSVLIGAGVELTKISDTFSLIIDGKYKLIVSSTEPINISTLVFTVGMKFPFN